MVRLPPSLIGEINMYGLIATAYQIYAEVTPLPPIEGGFLLLNGTQFLLLDGTDFNLLSPP